MPTLTRPDGKQLALSLVISLVVTASALGACEALLRWRGYRPWPDLRHLLHPREPPLLEPDPVLGWRNLPGRHVFPGYSPDVAEVRFTIWPDGRRATGEKPISRPQQVLLVGDSITAGWAISDEETFGWKLQSRLPAVEIVNVGAGGYGTYQSLLMMRRVFARDSGIIRLCLYGFIDDHEHRNVADFFQIRAVAVSSSQLDAQLPFSLLRADGGLDEHAPEPITRWPLHDKLASMRLLEEAHWQWLTAHRSEQGRPVTERILIEMDRLAREHRAQFFLVSLISKAEVAEHYRAFLAARGIAFIDCNRQLVPATMVRGEGHPNGLLHSEWARCIGDVIESSLRPSDGSR